MAGEKAIDVLRQEHVSIRKVTAAMSVLLLKLETDKQVKPETLRSLVEFMRLAGEMHERKEEAYLFPLLQSRGVSSSIAPVGTLVRNHHRARDLAARLDATTEANAAGWFPMQSPLLEQLQALTDIYPLHLWQEDMLVYRAADNVLTEQDNEKLIAAFRDHESGTGPDVRARLHALAEQVDADAWAL